jgi:hypothetical protein
VTRFKLKLNRMPAQSQPVSDLLEVEELSVLLICIQFRGIQDHVRIKASINVLKFSSGYF